MLFLAPIKYIFENRCYLKITKIPTTNQKPSHGKNLSKNGLNLVSLSST